MKENKYEIFQFFRLNPVFLDHNTVKKLDGSCLKIGNSAGESNRILYLNL